MLIVTFNVNSLRVRLKILQDFIAKNQPDIILLQEVKATAEVFPFLEISAMGYTVATTLQKTYNGVATLAKTAITVINTKLPNFVDAQARYLEVITSGIRVINVYIPNGNPLGTDKYTYKLDFLNFLYEHIQYLFSVEEDTPFILAGDFNIIPTQNDTYNEKVFLNDALYQKEVKDIYFKLLNLGLTDALAVATSKGVENYTWWDYRNRGFDKGLGIRIDHILLSPLLADRFLKAYVDKCPRMYEKPSDHTPVILEIS